jgi:hypothetical protein
MITWSTVFAVAIFIEGWNVNNEDYKFLLSYLKNEYFCALLCWVSRVIILSQLGSWIIPVHPIFFQYMMGWHVIEGVLMILILIAGAFVKVKK